jgi:hypothetical protein
MGYDINDALDACKVSNQWSDLAVARSLGCGKNSLKRWRSTGAPKYVVLALWALMKGNETWNAKLIKK